MCEQYWPASFPDRCLLCFLKVLDGPLPPRQNGALGRARPARVQAPPTGWKLAYCVPESCPGPLTRISSQLGNYLHKLPGRGYIIIIDYIYYYFTFHQHCIWGRQNTYQH